jgi:Kef-type K+ transport system membrane component KefB
MIYTAVLSLPKCFLKSIFLVSYGFSSRMEVLLNIVNAILLYKLHLIIWVWSVKTTIAWTFIFNLTRNECLCNYYLSLSLKIINPYLEEN